MYVLKRVVGGSVPLLVATACCGYDHGALAIHQVDCVFAETPVAWDAPDADGVTPADRLAPYVGAFGGVGVWADGSDAAFEGAIAPGDADPVRVDVTGGADAALCASGLSIPVRIAFGTPGGELAFDAEVGWDAGGEGLDLWLTAPVDGNAGTFDPLAAVGPNEAPAQWQLALAIDDGVPTGELALWVQGEDADTAWERSASVLGF